MYLKKLELNGFKSFAKPTSLEFSRRIVAIVGPNGSGKSNTSEAIAWVLGEQSTKNLRGKKSEDFIFNGSESVGRKNRACVSLSLGGLPDEILISRVVYRDGANEYLIDGSRRKLKDINEFLAEQGIGAPRHHIVGQNEADKILNASAVDRRKMVEETLGLKVYQLKKEESERKMKKAEENIRQVEALRQEINPHLRFLKKQSNKARESVALKDGFRDACSLYFSGANLYLEEKVERILREKRKCKNEIAEIEEKIKKAEDCLKGLNQGGPEIQRTREKINFLEREVGRREGILSQNRTPLFVGAEKIKSFVKFLEKEIDNAICEKNTQKVREILGRIKEKIACFFGNKENKDNEKKEEKERQQILEKLQSAKKDEECLMRDNERLRGAEIEIYQFKTQLNEKRREEVVLKEEENEARLRRNRITMDIKEAEAVLGEEIKTKSTVETGRESFADSSWRERKWREIERIRIKIEEGSGVGGEIIKEYEEIKTRDEFLSSQLLDLKKSVESLQCLINQLKIKMDIDFKRGVVKINEEFQKFFTLMFGGGNAELKIKTQKIWVEEEEEGGEKALREEGLEVCVNLPRKKSHSLGVLSGGERALTSIALLFAMSQVNPPPFLILDETDAALDESNSRKYAKMLRDLSECTQLILVTHNRETINSADVLYGVTMEHDGVSRVLSVKLEEAKELVE